MLQLISYDLVKPEKDYPSLIARLEQLGAQRFLYSEWFLATNYSTTAIRDDLRRYMDSNDRILVVEVKRNAAWDRLMLNDDTVQQFFQNAGG